MRINKKEKLICGVGINDADYNVCETAPEGKKHKIVWTCPFYVKWVNMLKRCYNQNVQMRNPSYVGCSTVPQWHLFSNFKSWMVQQDWEDKHLDKDLLFPGNKEYGPETCIFVDSKVNTFIIESNVIRGDWPIGVIFHKRKMKYMASCRSVETGEKKYLGLFKTPEEAHAAWLAYKLTQAYIIADQLSDQLVAKALIARYENYN